MDPTATLTPRVELGTILLRRRMLEGALPEEEEAGLAGLPPRPSALEETWVSPSSAGTAGTGDSVVGGLLAVVVGVGDGGDDDDVVSCARVMERKRKNKKVISKTVPHLLVLCHVLAKENNGLKCLLHMK